MKHQECKMRNIKSELWLEKQKKKLVLCKYATICALRHYVILYYKWSTIHKVLKVSFHFLLAPRNKQTIFTKLKTLNIHGI